MKKLIPFIIIGTAPYLLFGFFAMLFGGGFNALGVQTEGFYAIVLCLILFFFVGIAISLITAILALTKKWDSESLIFANMLVKLIQIPAYVLIFALGIVSMLTIFTFAFVIVYFLFDCMSVFMTGMIGMAGAVRANKEGKLTKASIVWFSIFSYIFCVDVIIAVIMFKKSKKSVPK